MTQTPTTKIDLCSKAMLKIGTITIESFKENSAESIIASQFYEMVKENMLAEYNWSFATKIIELNQINFESNLGYKNIFQLPSDLIKIISVSDNVNFMNSINYKLFQDELHSNSEKVFLKYTFNIREKYFPNFFQRLLITALAKEFIIPLMEDDNKYRIFSDELTNEIRRARNTDSNQTSQQKIRMFPLTAIR